MKRIFLDTNFLMDFLERKELKAICEEILIKGKEYNLKFYISFLSLANFAFINRKKDKEILYKALKLLMTMFKVISNTQEEIMMAIELDGKDFEDAIQYATALRGKCDCIITNNSKDFLFSTLPIHSPQQFLEILNQDSSKR